jgi:hypothetical protein
VNSPSIAKDRIHSVERMSASQASEEHSLLLGSNSVGQGKNYFHKLKKLILISYR